MRRRTVLQNSNRSGFLSIQYLYIFEPTNVRRGTHPNSFSRVGNLAVQRQLYQRSIYLPSRAKSRYAESCKRTGCSVLLQLLQGYTVVGEINSYRCSRSSARRLGFSRTRVLYDPLGTHHRHRTSVLCLLRGLLVLLSCLYSQVHSRGVSRIYYSTTPF